MNARDEPAYMLAARYDARNGHSTSPGIVRELVARIDRDAKALKAAQPRTITDHYAEGGTDSLRGGSVILSHGEPLLAQSDGTFCDPTGSTWDFWELELPITVIHEPEATQ